MAATTRQVSLEDVGVPSAGDPVRRGAFRHLRVDLVPHGPRRGTSAPPRRASRGSRAWGGRARREAVVREDVARGEDPRGRAAVRVLVAREDPEPRAVGETKATPPTEKGSFSPSPSSRRPDGSDDRGPLRITSRPPSPPTRHAAPPPDAPTRSATLDAVSGGARVARREAVVALFALVRAPGYSGFSPARWRTAPWARSRCSARRARSSTGRTVCSPPRAHRGFQVGVDVGDGGARVPVAAPVPGVVVRQDVHSRTSRVPRERQV